MFKKYAKIGAVLVGLAAGLAAIPAGTASAEPAACSDFRTIYNYYVSIGDYVTADALYANMDSARCDVERRLIA
jgi:hypothetical protein